MDVVDASVKLTTLLRMYYDVSICMYIDLAGE